MKTERAFAAWPEVAAELIAVAARRAPADLGDPQLRLGERAFARGDPGRGHRDQGRAASPPAGRTPAAMIGPETRVIDAGGRFLIPGLCDGHMHVESGMLTVSQFVRAVMPHGTTTMFTDPHEVANVLGLAGRAADARRGDGAADQRLRRDAVLRALRAGAGDAGRRARAGGRRRGDGLAADHRARRDDELSRRDRLPTRRCSARSPRPRRRARPWAGIMPARISPTSRPMPPAGRRTTTRARREEDAIMRVRQGMRAMLRLGSAWYDVKAQITAVTEKGLDPRNFILCTDDCHSGTLVNDGPHGPGGAARHRLRARPAGRAADGDDQHRDAFRAGARARLHHAGAAGGLHPDLGSPRRCRSRR